MLTDLALVQDLNIDFWQLAATDRFLIYSRQVWQVSRVKQVQHLYSCTCAQIDFLDSQFVGCLQVLAGAPQHTPVQVLTCTPKEMAFSIRETYYTDSKTDSINTLEWRKWDSLGFCRWLTIDIYACSHPPRSYEGPHLVAFESCRCWCRSLIQEQNAVTVEKMWLTFSVTMRHAGIAGVEKTWYLAEKGLQEEHTTSTWNSVH